MAGMQKLRVSIGKPSESPLRKKMLRMFTIGRMKTNGKGKK